MRSGAMGEGREAPADVIPGWLKGLVVAGALVLIAVDLGAPLVVRVQLDGTASDAVAAGGRTWLRVHDLKAAEAAARDEVVADGATLERFEVLADGRVTMTVTQQVDGLVLDGLDQLASWYAVRVDVTSSGTTL